MTDQAQVPVAAPVTQPDNVVTPPSDVTAVSTPPSDTPSDTSKPSEKSPLDMLDEILKEAQSKSAETVVAQQKEAAEKAAAEALIRKQANDQKIAEELAALNQEKFSPQEIAKAAQEEEKKKAEDAYKSEMDGMTIHQLGHTKV